MKKVEVFQADDGTIFKNQAECIAHEEEIMFGKWYEDHEILGNYLGSKVDLKDIKEWLRENKEIIFRFLFQNSVDN
jgi:hypothetical protein